MHTLFLLGDAGDHEFNDPVLGGIEKELAKAGKNATLLILGDNIYPAGLSDTDSPTRQQEEETLNRVLNITRRFAGKTILIPGNHDWAEMRRSGWQNVLNQQQYVEKHFNSIAFFPKDGMPGPTTVHLTENISLIIIDFQWFIHKWEKPLLVDGSMELNLKLFLKKLDEYLAAERDKTKVVLCHHPMISYGDHGKKLPWKHLLFPFGTFRPQPALGYFIPFHPDLKGEYQDIAHPRYRHVKQQIMSVLKRHSPLFFVSGHDHSFQHLVADNNHHIICGSASRSGKVYKGPKALFVSNEKGFGKLAVKEKEIGVEFVAVSGGNLEIAYRTSLDRAAFIK